MSGQLPPNVRWVEESYGETWPTATQYGSVHFGPVTEGLHVTLPCPVEMDKLRVEDQWDWLRAPENAGAAQSTIIMWAHRLSVEHAQVHSRLRAVIIERVNAALLTGEIRNAVLRDPETGKPVPPAPADPATFFPPSAPPPPVLPSQPPSQGGQVAGTLVPGFTVSGGGQR